MKSPRVGRGPTILAEVPGMSRMQARPRRRRRTSTPLRPLDRLMSLLADRAESNDALQRELRRRATELEQLAALLQHKELQLARIDGLSSRQGGGLLCAARSRARRSLALCACREWRHVAAAACRRRDLRRRRVEGSDADVRRACELLGGALVRAARRSLGAAVEGLWLCAASQPLGPRPPSPRPGAGSDGGGVRAGGPPQGGFVAATTLALDECQVIFETPRLERARGSDAHEASLVGDLFAGDSARRDVAGLAQEALLRTVRLAAGLERAELARLGWSWRRLRRCGRGEAAGLAPPRELTAVAPSPPGPEALALDVGSTLLSVQDRIDVLVREGHDVASRRSAYEAKLHKVVKACDADCSRLARAKEWEKLATVRVREMSERGVVLQSQREKLRGRLHRTKEQTMVAEQEQHFTQMLLDQAAATCASLRKQLNERSAAVVEAREVLHRARAERSDDTSRHATALAAAHQMLTGLRAIAQKNEMHGTAVAEAARHEAPHDSMRQAWSLEAETWANAQCALEAQLRDVAAEAAAARCECDAALEESRVAAQRAAAHRFAAAARADAAQQAAWSAARADVEGATAVCEGLRFELETRLKHLDQLEAEVLRHEAVELARVGADETLRELDAYAAIIVRLRAELQREREEREASETSLRSLQGAYRLLLARVGTR